MSTERTETDALFNAAVDVAHKTYGPREMVESVGVVMRTGLMIHLDVPPGWEPEEHQPQRIKGVEAVAEVLFTIMTAGHRMTRQAIVEAMEDAGRSRAESAVGEALQQLTELGILTNRQNTSPKGYGLPSYEGEAVHLRNGNGKQ